MSSLVLPATSGRELILRALRSRWQWILAGIVLGLAGAGVYLGLESQQIIATTTVNVVAVNSEDTGASARSAASIIDMPTEMELARSAITAEGAATRLGPEWDAIGLMRGTTVTGDSSGTVLKISYRDRDADRARQGADAMAASYLESRATLAKARYDNRIQHIDTQLFDHEKELAASTDDLGRSAKLRAEIDELVSQRYSLADPTVKAGQIISSAEQSTVKKTPPTVGVIAGGSLLGLFLGLVALFLRGAFSNRIARGDDLAEALRLPVFMAEAERRPDDSDDFRMSAELDQTTSVLAIDAALAGRWASAVELVMSITDASPILLVLDPDSPDADELFLTLKAAVERSRDGVPGSQLQVVDATGPSWRVVRAAASAPVYLLAVSSDFSKSEIVALSDQIEMTGCRALGAMFLSSSKGRSAKR